MKSKFIKFLILFVIFFLNNTIHAENISIQSKEMSFDKDNEVSIFTKNVEIKTEDENTINSEFAKYNKKLGIITLRNNIIVTDSKNNTIKAEYAEYFEKKKILKINGFAEIITSEDYKIKGEDIILDDINKSIISKKNAVIIDNDENIISLENFEFTKRNNLFKSIGLIKIEDKKNNIYEFSQIYIDTKKKEIFGTDSKSFLNDENLKVNPENKPRVFSNSTQISQDKSIFDKSVFTLCDYRENDKCPPWTIKASKMVHDSNKKTIYYDNAIIKIYDLPIFYIPRLSHPDPSVDRRSGFLPPSFSDSKNLGTAISIPYFWSVNEDKNFTLNSKLFSNENPLITGEYHQALKRGSFISDFGFTEGYKKDTNNKKKGDKSHFFFNFSNNFNTDDFESSLSVDLQHVSNDKYLKLYKINSNLVEYSTNSLKNTIDYSYQNNDLFFGVNTSVYETLNETYSDKYEYILPQITFDKNIINSEKFGLLDLQTNYKVHKYDTNKLTNFLVNNFNWVSKDFNHSSGLKSNFLGSIKNINYEAKNTELYKENTTSELFGVLGYEMGLDLFKVNNQTKHLLSPKILVKYSPGSMRKESEGTRLTPITAFDLDRTNDNYNFETGLNSTVGFDYQIEKRNQKFDFSIAQIINEKENKKLASKTGLDEKLSDVIGSSNFKINENFEIKHDFLIDQNFRELNYNEIGSSLNFDPFKIDFSYLQEDKHVGEQEYFKTKLNYNTSNNGLVSFETKRNLITNSSEFYNLSYEYNNDFLRAGLVYRREYYTDSEIEPENSLMFKITLTPFGNISSPSFSQ